VRQGALYVSQNADGSANTTFQVERGNPCGLEQRALVAATRCVGDQPKEGSMNASQAVLIGAAMIVGAIVATRPQTPVDAQSTAVGTYALQGGSTGGLIYRINTITGAVSWCNADGGNPPGKCTIDFRQE
jgi:hypothetical protein